MIGQVAIDIIDRALRCDQIGDPNRHDIAIRSLVEVRDIIIREISPYEAEFERACLAVAVLRNMPVDAVRTTYPASAKIRAHGAVDEEADYDWPVWSGVVPVRLQVMQPEPDPRNIEGIDVPDYVRRLTLG